MSNVKGPDEAQNPSFEELAAQYQCMWYFWPLEAQKEALGPHHDVPQGNEINGISLPKLQSVLSGNAMDRQHWIVWEIGKLVSSAVVTRRKRVFVWFGKSASPVIQSQSAMVIA